MRQLTVGIIGVGRIGRIHAENILYRIARMHLQTVVDPYIDVQWATAHNIPNYSKDPDTIFNDHKIDAVIICTPAPTHVPFIIKAANTNKHIFCEKPLSLNVNEIHQAIKAVNKAGVKLQVGFNRRFDPQFMHVAEHVHTGKIGQPHIFRLNSRDPKPPPIEYVKNCGGIFLDMSVHDFDMARFLSGEEIVEVFAMGANLINPEFSRYNDVDTALIQLKFTSGALGVIDNSRQAVYGYDQRVEVFGSQGCIITENNTPTRTQLSTKENVSVDKPLHFFLDRYNVSYCRELECFVDSILADKACLVDGNDGLMALIAGLAAKQSLQENRPVKLSKEYEYELLSL